MAETKKIQLQAEVDASGVEKGFQRMESAGVRMAQSVQKSGKEASKGVDAVGDSAKKLGDSWTREEGRVRGAIQRATLDLQTLGKSASEKFEARIQMQGLDTSKFQPYIAQLRALETQQNKTGVSAAQTAAAVRGVPAQFTDIFTSLAAGQNPLQVFLQQGGQLKDMFGGVGPAARALGGYLLGLINPFTLTAAAVATLGVAFHQGEKETTEYNKALILTGNYLGLTVSQLQIYAKQISAVAGTQGAAAEALTALASSGKVATQSLTEVGTAVVLMNRVLGQSVDEATKVFVQLADEPTKASAKLNESMHYLNLATFERIRALEEQGQKEQAAALAQSTYAQETTARLQRVEASAGTLERGWRTLADGAKAAWDAMLNVGRQQSVGDALATAQQKLAEAQAQVAKGGPYAALYGAQAAKQQQAVNDLSRKAIRESENAAAESEKAKTNAAQIGASERIRVAAKEAQTNADMREKFKKQTLADYKTLGDAAFKVASEGKTPEQVIADYNEKHKDQKGPKAKEFRDDAGTKTLQTLREQEAALKAQLDVNDKLTAADQERAKYIQLFADLKDKKVLTADQKSLLAQKDAILAQLDQNVAVEKQLELKKEQAKLDEKAKRNAEEFARQIQGINISIESASRSRSEQYDRQLSTMGLGSQAREEVESQKQVRREYEAYRRQLTKDAAEKNQLGSQAYIDEVARIDEALNGELGRLQQYWDDRRAIQADGIKGAQEALADYVTYVDNAFDRSGQLVSDGLRGLNDALTDATFTGDLSSFKKFGESIGRQILNGIYETYVTKPIAQMIQDSLKGDDSFGIGGILNLITGGKSPGKTSGGTDEIGGLISSLGLGGSESRGSSPVNPLYVQSVGLGDASSSGSMLAGLFGGGSSGGGSGSSDDIGALISLLGYSGGGFTGPGGKYQPAGIVHAGEGVLSQEDIRSLGGERGFNSLRLLLRRGYADGGYVSSVMGGRLGGGRSASPIGGTTNHNVFNMNFSGNTSRDTASQVALRVSRELQRSGRDA